MKFIRPQYLRDFRCLADRCGDTCCAGWEICIDPESYKKYQSTPGTIGERLRSSILCGEAGAEFVLRPGKRCPFLNERNLCELILELGEDSLCEICREHPRFYLNVGGEILTGLGLCCEEAARLILTRDLRLETVDCPDECAATAPEDAPEDEVLLLKTAWQNALGFVERAEFPLAQQMSGLLVWGEALQEALEFGEALPGLAPLEAAPQNAPGDWRALIPIFQRLEVLDTSWPELLQQALKNAGPALAVPEFEPYARRLTRYFLYRHFLQAIYDGDVLSKIKFSLLSVCVICALAAHRLSEQGALAESDWIALAKRYSMEIEYSDENVDALWDACWKEPALETQSLVSLF